MISDIISKAEHGGSVTSEEVVRLLSVDDPSDVDELFSAARRAREKNFGNKIFTYGFVYFSTYCKNNCSFCYYRRSNKEIERYRKTMEDIVQLSGGLKDAGINLVDLTMGEDPQMYANGYKGLLDIVSSVHDDVGISTMVSPGALPRDMFSQVREAGGDWIACYQETYNRDVFAKMRLEQDFEARRNQKIWAREAGLLAEDGMMIGLGENMSDRADTILEMGGLGCEQIRAMTFVPQEGTPMQTITPRDSSLELRAIAIMRILFPDRLIPASLDVEGIAGLKSRLNAGANVITSIVPPNMNLAGVAQHDLDIENGNRSVNHVFEMLDDMGYRTATCSEYVSFLDSRRKGVSND